MAAASKTGAPSSAEIHRGQESDPEAQVSSIYVAESARLQTLDNKNFDILRSAQETDCEQNSIAVNGNLHFEVRCLPLTCLSSPSPRNCALWE